MLRSVLLSLALSSFAMPAPRLEEKISAEEKAKRDDPIGWAVKQPVESKPWRYLYEVEQKNDAEWTKKHGPRLANLLRDRFDAGIITVFDTDEEIAHGHVAGVLFHAMTAIDGSPRCEDW